MKYPPGEDLVKTSEFADITNMIEKLSKDVLEDSETHDKVNQGTVKPSKEVSVNVSAHSKHDTISSVLLVNEELLPSMMSHQVSAEESSTDLVISRSQEVEIENDNTLENEEKSSPYEQDDKEEDEEDFDDCNAVVYSSTLGNNLPGFIQTVVFFMKIVFILEKVL